jgi:hypothetical protein
LLSVMVAVDVSLHHTECYDVNKMVKLTNQPTKLTPARKMRTAGSFETTKLTYVASYSRRQ